MATFDKKRQFELHPIKYLKLLKQIIMRLQSVNLLGTLNNKEINSLTKVVKETLDCNFKKVDKKIFSDVDLWNIYKHKIDFGVHQALKI